MSIDFYGGHLLSSVAVDKLHALFRVCGIVESIALMTDRVPGHQHGFRLVTMPSGASTALPALHHTVGQGVS